MSATYDAPSVDFYFDVQCPYAYIASRRVESVVKSTGTVVNWTPVLLGGLYDLTNAEQGKAGSASDVMPVTKKALVSLDFNREVNRLVQMFLMYNSGQKQATLRNWSQIIDIHSSSPKLRHPSQLSSATSTPIGRRWASVMRIPSRTSCSSRARSLSRLLGRQRQHLISRNPPSYRSLASTPLASTIRTGRINFLE